MLAAAAARGLAEIAFCEHVFHVVEALDAVPWLGRFRPEAAPLGHADYARAVREAAERAALPVRLGVELDVYADDPEVDRGTVAFVEAHGAEWDVALGSVHVIAGDIDVHGPELRIGVEAAWEDYQRRIAAAARSGSYDVVTHPVRLGEALRGAPTRLAELLDESARAAAESGTALEVNGYDTHNRPDLVEELIRACARHDTPISLGSDAHSPPMVGSVLAALPMLQRAGVERVARFERRRLELVPLAA